MGYWHLYFILQIKGAIIQHNVYVDGKDKGIEAWNEECADQPIQVCYKKPLYPQTNDGIFKEKTAGYDGYNGWIKIYI